MADTLPEPKSRKEQYLAKAAGMDTEIPAEPMSREEQYLNAIAEGGGGGGGGVTPEQLDARVKLNAGAPASTMVGTIGQLIEDTTNGALYQLTSIDSGATVDTTAGLTSYLNNITFSFYNATTFSNVIAPFKLAAGEYMIRRNSGANAYYVSTVDNDTSLGVITGVAAYNISNGMGIMPNPMAAFNQVINSMVVKTPIFSFTMKPGDPAYNWENVKSPVAQTTGNSDSSVMSQKAVTDTLFYNNNNKVIAIAPFDNNHNGGNCSVMLNGTVDNGSGYSFAACGGRAYSSYAIAIGQYAGPDEYAIALGSQAKARGTSTIAIGTNTNTNYKSYAVALGAYSQPTRDGEVNVGLVSGQTSAGYNNTAYRLIGGVHPGVDTHDVVTVGQISQLLSEINSALGTSLTITNGVITNGGGGNVAEDPSDPSDPGDPGDIPAEG